MCAKRNIEVAQTGDERPPVTRGRMALDFCVEIGGCGEPCGRTLGVESGVRHASARRAGGNHESAYPTNPTTIYTDPESVWVSGIPS